MIENKHIALAAIAIVLIAGLIIAKPVFEMFNPQEKIDVPVGPSQGKADVKIPAHAIEVAPGVFFLGTEVKNGKLLEGYAIVDYKRDFAKPSGCNNDGKCQGWEDKSCEDCTGGTTEPDSSCYGFLSKGAKWRTVEPYLINPSNSRGLNTPFVTDNFASDIDKWEDAAGAEILGDGSVTNTTLSADMDSTDGKNEVYFGEIADVGAIGITIVWGVFRGPPSSRELVEWDMVFDQVDFDWSDSGEPGKMDFESIATHELGHAIGLDDLYTSDCSEETMYGYASYGETKKSTLEAGDIAGAKELYG
jgi:hypothetical protein